MCLDGGGLGVFFGFFSVELVALGGYGDGRVGVVMDEKVKMR